MNHDFTAKAVDLLNEELRSLGIERSYARLKHLKSTDTYEVRVVVHPDEADVIPKFPAGVTTEPWGEDSDAGSPYVKITPRTPMPTTDKDFFYPSWAKRRTDGPSSSPDTNPAASGLRRIPDLQDLVRVSSMNNDLKRRLNRVIRYLQAANRIQRVAGVGSGYARESEYLVSELLKHLADEGHTGRHKIVRLVKALKKAMSTDGYTFAGDN